MENVNEDQVKNAEANIEDSMEQLRKAGEQLDKEVRDGDNPTTVGSIQDYFPKGLSKIPYDVFRENVVLKLIMDVDMATLNTYEDIQKWAKESKDSRYTPRYIVAGVGPQVTDFKVGDEIVIEGSQGVITVDISTNEASFARRNKQVRQFHADFKDGFVANKFEKLTVEEYAFTKEFNIVMRVCN